VTIFFIVNDYIYKNSLLFLLSLFLQLHMQLIYDVYYPCKRNSFHNFLTKQVINRVLLKKNMCKTSLASLKIKLFVILI